MNKLVCLLPFSGQMARQLSILFPFLFQSPLFDLIQGGHNLTRPYLFKASDHILFQASSLAGLVRRPDKAGQGWAGLTRLGTLARRQMGQAGRGGSQTRLGWAGRAE